MKKISEYYNYNTQTKKDFKKDINGIIDKYLRKKIFSFRITQYLLNVEDKDKKFEVIIMGAGPFGDLRWKESPLYKIKFFKKRKIWDYKLVRSLLLRELQENREEGENNDELFNLIDEILIKIEKK